MIQHRFRTITVIGEWRTTREEARRDALQAGLARRDEQQPDGVTWAVPGVIEIMDRQR
jgi:hypothetical protein